MFYAFIVICAANINLEVDADNCVYFKDIWGPYVTVENCHIRVNQMITEMLEPPYIIDIDRRLGSPPFYYRYGYCNQSNEVQS